jgi:hypothetical protein
MLRGPWSFDFKVKMDHPENQKTFTVEVKGGFSSGAPN